MKTQVLQEIDRLEPAYVQVWEEIVRRESSSYEKAGVDAVADYLTAVMEEIGLDVSRVHFERAGDSLQARTRQIADAAKPPVLLMAHMDTVHQKGSFGEETFRREGEFVCGPGVFDCKGGIAVALLATQALLAAGYREREIRFVFSGDEEVSHALSDFQGIHVYEEMAEGAAAAFNCESAMMNGDVVTGRKGGAEFTITVHGVASHAGRDPEKGASAIREMARKILAIEALTDYQGTTYNCGVIEGGTVPNTIPAECRIHVDVRYRTNEGYEEAVRCLQEITADCLDPRVHAEIELNSRFGAMERTAGTDALYATYREACRELFEADRLPEEAYTGGCSDAAWVTRMGVPTLCGVGIRGMGNHTLEEKAVIASLGEQAKKLALTILELE